MSSGVADQQADQRAKQEIEALAFEEALAELEAIVRTLESGQQSLEDAITAYERGNRLRRHCEAKLAAAEARVQAIVERPEGGLALDPPARAGGG